MPTVTDELSPSPSSSPESLRLGFRPATLDGPPSSPLPNPSPTPGLESLDDAPEVVSDSGDEWDAATSPESPAGTSSPASIRASEALPPEGLRDMFRGGVIIAGDQAHNYLARTPGQRHEGLYRTDEEDAANIGDPLASLAARHSGAGEVSEDTRDLLAAVMGMIRYGSKQIIRSQTARQLDAATAGQPQHFPEDAA